jgi:hypothetical protein
MSVRVTDRACWSMVQQRLRSGDNLTLLLPLGRDDTWLQLQARDPLPDDIEIHSSVLPATLWLNFEELPTVTLERKRMAFWRDSIDRFVSACLPQPSDRTHHRPGAAPIVQCCRSDRIPRIPLGAVRRWLCPGGPGRLAGGADRGLFQQCDRAEPAVAAALAQ